jgi:sialidase-1
VAVELVDGRVYVNSRDQNGSSPENRTVAYSSDGGQSFDAPFKVEPGITSPVVQNSTIRMWAKDQGDKQNLLVHSGPGAAKDRRDLTLLTSADEGKTWQRRMVLHEGPAAYSDLVKLDDSHVGVLYEAGKKLYSEIVFAVVDVQELVKE